MFLRLFIFILVSNLFFVPAVAQKISQFETAGLCDFLIDKNGVYHAVFQESPDRYKPTFIYYAASRDGGNTWSKPVTLSNDNTGNGAGYPRIIQDGNGIIYAIWKRYGIAASLYPIPSSLLDGPGGYTLGTLFYKALTGGAWSNAVQLNEAEAAQNSWFATVDPAGTVRVVWDQLSFQSIRDKQNMWYYCDFVRTTTLNGANHTGIVDLNKPGPPEYQGGPPLKKGAINLDGYVDANNALHMIYEDINDNAQEIKYFDGKAVRIVYTYPKYQEGNTFNNPPRLLTDEKGVDHLLFWPSSQVLESEQIWDLNLATNKTTVLTSIQEKGVSIKGFQAYPGPKGGMSVIVEAGTMTDNTDAYGFFYNNGRWASKALTKNPAQKTVFSTLTRYNSSFAAVAEDARGNKSMLMNVNAYWTNGNSSVSSPSLIFLRIP